MAGVDWETAYKRCSLQNDSLIDIQDVQNHFSFLKGLLPIWSSVKGHFTPWIAYRGCFRKSVCTESTRSQLKQQSSHYIDNNTAGNCYFECISKNNTNRDCANKANFFFALSKSLCLCLCGNAPLQNISNSSKCELSCGSSIDNGECGGIGHFSLYEPMHIKLPETYLGGFCLTCRARSDLINTQLYSGDCNGNIAGYCITNNGRMSLPPLVSTFASYWNHCKNQSMYIVGDTSHTLCQKEDNVWTGLRKYKIDISNIDNELCYIIDMHQDTINYKNGNCTENRLFLCKRDISPSNKYSKSTEKIAPPPFSSETSWKTKTTSSYKSLSSRGITSHFNITTYTPPPSIGNLATIVGASTAGIIALTFVVFFILCLLKRRKFQCLQVEQQANHHHGSNDSTYSDLVATSTRQVDSHIYTTLPYNKQVIL